MIHCEWHVLKCTVSFVAYITGTFSAAQIVDILTTPESSSGVCVGTLPLGTADGFLSAYISLHWSQSMYLFVLLCL